MDRPALVLAAILAAAAARADAPAQDVGPEAAEPRAAAGAPPAPAVDDLELGRLQRLVWRTSPRNVGRLVATEPAFARLDGAARARLLASLRERTAPVGIALNLLVGWGFGSFAQGDTMGGLVLAGAELGSLLVVATGVTISEESEAAALPVLVVGVAGFLGTRVVAAIVRPLRFRGAHYHALEDAFSSAPAVSLFAAPRPLLAGGGYQAGLVLRF